MPIRIPQIVSQQGLAAQPGPMLDPSGAASIATAPARALVQASETISKSVAEYQRVNQKLTEQDMKFDEKTKLSELKELLALEDIRMQEEGVEPDSLAPTFQQRGGQAVQQLTGQLKYSASAREFQAEADALLRLETTKQRYKGLARKEARTSINAALDNQDLALRAINADDPSAAMAAIEDNVRELVATGIWSAPKGESEILQARTQIIEGRVVRQFDEKPEMRTKTITALRGAKVPGVSAERQYALADKLEQKERAEVTRLKTEKKEAEKAAGDTADRKVTDLILMRRFGEARLVLTETARFHEPSRYSTLSNTITVQETKGGPSNPVTLQRLKAATHSITTDPVAVLNELQQAMADGLLTVDDFTPMATHVETRIKVRKEGDPLLGRQHAQAEQLLTESLRVTGPAAAVLNGPAQNVYSLALEDLSRSSSYLGQGEENPLEWQRRTKAFYVAQLGSVASQRLAALNKQLRDGRGQAYATGDPKADAQALLQRRATFKSEGDFKDQARILRESADIRQAMKELQERTGAFPVAPLPGYGPEPSSKPPPASGGGGGQSLGRKQGPPGG